jgi:hypothetical protein
VWLSLDEALRLLLISLCIALRLGLIRLLDSGVGLLLLLFMLLLMLLLLLLL